MNPPRAEHRMLTRAVLGRSHGGATAGLNGARWDRIDWDYAVRAAERVGSLALLGVALARDGAPRPPGVDQRCRQARIQGALRALVAERILGDIDERFRRAGVEFMVLKGLPLAQELYGEPGLRPMDDLDLLVRRKERERALEAMREVGYRLPPGSLSQRFYLRHHFHLLMLRQAPAGLPVELHWDTQPFFSTSLIPEEEFWEGRRLCQVGSVGVTVPGREQEFLYLIQHLSRHLLGWGPEVAEDPVAVFLDPARRGRLTWLADLELLSTAQPKLDRDGLARMAERWFMVDELRSALRLLEGVHGAADGSGTAPSAPPDRRRRLPAGQRWAGRLPWLGNTSQTLHFRPILAFHVVRFAFPGAPLIRHRYGGAGMGGVRLALQTLRHAVEVVLKAVTVGLSYLLEVCRRPLRPRGTDRLGGRGDR